jgi:hypothetical protein
MTTSNSFSADDLFEFLEHAGDRGLMPAATAQALAVASRNVLGVLSDHERADLSQQDVAALVKRFTNKRAKDFNPSSLKEYGRRVHRAFDLFLKWREDPANFSVRTRTTAPRKRIQQEVVESAEIFQPRMVPDQQAQSGTYQSAVPVRAGIVVTLSNIPRDLTRAEAERLAEFVRMLAVDFQT